MASNLDRIQTLLQPAPYAKVRTLAREEGRTLSAMAAQLIDDALALPKWREILEAAEERGGSVPERPVDRAKGQPVSWRKGEREGPTYEELFTNLTEDKLEKLQKLMKLAEML